MISLYILGIVLWILLVNIYAAYHKNSAMEILTAVAMLWPIALPVLILIVVGAKIGNYLKELK